MYDMFTLLGLHVLKDKVSYQGMRSDMQSEIFSLYFIF